MDDKTTLAAFLETAEYLVLAVTLDDGTPWATPVKIQAWDGQAFEWDSKVDTLHSQAIMKRPEVALSVFSTAEMAGGHYGFYAQARAELVREDERGFGRWRAVVTKAWVNDHTFQKREVTLG